MTIEQLRRMIDAAPFRPFTIHRADGKEVLVRHPELIMAPPRSRTVVVWMDDAQAFEFIRLSHVTRLETGQ